MLSLQQGPDRLRQCFVKHATFGEHEIPFCFQTGPRGESLPSKTVQRYGSEERLEAASLKSAPLPQVRLFRPVHTFCVL